ARNAKKKVAGVAGTSTPAHLGDPSDRTSPAISVEIVGEKRPREDDLGETHTSRQTRRVDDVEDLDNSLGAGLHKMTPGVPAAKFVLPPAFSHGQLFDGETRMIVPPADEAILADTGSEAIRGEIASRSVAVFKLLETVTFLNDRECKYLQERDAVRKRVKDVGLQLSEL
ncbi:hypothetical protein A2U01_0042418, partial [Trifolium medium]|nr:hypothetical protein [Trifolium medium]